MSKYPSSSSRKPESSKSTAPARPNKDYDDSDDEVPELPTMRTRAPTQFPSSGGSSRSPGTTLNRDKPLSVGTTLNRDKPQAAGTTLNRDKLPSKTMNPGTMLNRDKPNVDPLSAATTLGRDLSQLPKAKSIMINAIASKRPATTALAHTTSILLRPKDKAMALKQLRIDEMGPAERAAQDKWAAEQLAKSPNCPDNNAWVRKMGGYQCKGLGHGITDSLLAEGKNGLMALETYDWEDSDNWVGPYYPMPDGSGLFEKGQFPTF